MAREEKKPGLQHLLEIIRSIRDGLATLTSLLREAVTSLHGIHKLLAEANSVRPPHDPAHTFFDASYLTNDCLRIEARSHVLWVNGKALTLGDREFILVSLLARHALEVAAMGGEAYLHKDDLLEEIDDSFDTLWKSSTREDVDHVVNTLRGKLGSVNISRDLIDTSQKNKIRLSTPPDNIRFAKDLDL